MSERYYIDTALTFQHTATDVGIDLNARLLRLDYWLGEKWPGDEPTGSVLNVDISRVSATVVLYNFPAELNDTAGRLRFQWVDATDSENELAWDADEVEILPRGWRDSQLEQS